MKMTRGKAAALAVLAVLGTAGALFYQGTLVRRCRRQLEYSYHEAVGQLAESTASLACDLEKACYAGTPEALWEASARLWRESGTAKTALSALPVRGAGLAETSGFLSRAGDYALSLARQGTDADRGELAALLPYAQDLARKTGELESALLSGELPAAELASGYLSGEKGRKDTARPAMQAEDRAESSRSAGEDAYASLEEGFAGMPRLVYDGPFSTHLEDRQSPWLGGMAHVDREQARWAAARAMGVRPGDLSDAGDENGPIPAYRFACGSRCAAVTKRGGFPLWMTDSRRPAHRLLGPAEAKTAALRFLEEQGFGETDSAYYEIYDNICVLNFAALQSGVICYTDLVKVGVSLEDGSILQLDARGWLMNHRKRSFARFAPPEERSLSPLLRPLSRRKALIPSPGGREVLCEEILCEGLGGRQVLVYLDAADGSQRDLLLLDISPNGKLTV